MAPRTPSGRGERGRRLWRELTAAGTLSPAHRVLAEEACRLADRLDGLNALLAAETVEWALKEARLSATALKGIAAELRQAAARETAKQEQPAPSGGGSNVTDIRSRVAAARRSASAV